MFTYAAILTGSLNSIPVTFKIIYLFIFRVRGEGEGRRETSMCKRNIYQLPLTHPQMGTWPATQVCVLTGK